MHCRQQPTIVFPALVASCLLATSVSAAAQTLPSDVESMTGIWAEHCSDPDDFFSVIGADAVIDMNPDMVFHTDLARSWLAEEGSEISLHEDGEVMRLQFADGEYLELYSCDALPGQNGVFFSEAVQFKLDTAELGTTCEVDRQQCLNQFMSMVDMGNTGTINEADLSRLIRIATFFGMVDEQETSTQDLIGAQVLAMALAPTVARAFIRNFDYDGDGALSLDELLVNRGQLEQDLAGLTGDTASGLEQSLRQQIDQLIPLLMQLQ